MKKIFFAISISTLFLLNTKAQINYHVYGSIARNDVERIYIFNGKAYMDSAQVIAGKFDMKGSCKSPVVSMLMTMSPFSASKIIVDNGECKVTLDDKLKASIETTSRNYNVMMNWIDGNILKANNKAKDSLLAEYKLQIEKGNYSMTSQYLTKYQDIQFIMLDYYKKLASDNSDCFIIPYILKDKDILTQENFGATFEKLSPEVKNNEFGQLFKTSLQNRPTPKPDRYQLDIKMLGTMAKYFETKQIDDKIFNLASLKGKWVLLDFWASWCAPCRAETPVLIKAYEQFKDKNFVIASVSLDKTTAPWLKALSDDSIPPFINTIIAESVNSDGFKYYNVNSIPANFLINPEGRIVALGLRGEELMKTLTRLIK